MEMQNVAQKKHTSAHPPARGEERQKNNGTTGIKMKEKIIAKKNMKIGWKGTKKWLKKGGDAISEAISHVSFALFA